MTRKVVHLITGLDIGGAEQMLLNVVPRLNEHGLENHVVCMKGRGVVGKELQKKGVTVHYLDFNHLWDAPKSILRFLKEMKRLKPDVLVTYLVHADIFGRMVGSMMAKIPKSIVYRRGPYLQWEFLNRFDRWTSGRVAKYLVVSNWLKRELEQKGFKKEKIQVLGNSVDEESFQHRKASGLREEDWVVGIVSTLKKGKGHSELLEAIQEVSVPVMVWILGEGPERNVLEKKVSDLGLKDRVTFLGFRRDVPELLSAMDLFVLPTHFEGMSVALLQAMAAGKCIITTGIEANRDLVTHGESAVLVPVQNPKALACAIESLLNDPRERQRLGENARKRCREKFSLEAHVKEFATILKNV